MARNNGNGNSVQLSLSLVPSDILAVLCLVSTIQPGCHRPSDPPLANVQERLALTDYEAELISSIDGLKRQVNDLKFAVDEAESKQSVVRSPLSQLPLVNSSKSKSPLFTLLVPRFSYSRICLPSCHLIALEQNQTVHTPRPPLSTTLHRNRTHRRSPSWLQLAADNAKERTGGRAGSSGEDKLMTASQDVTDALRRTVSLMSSELEKSAMSSQLLEESSQTLSSLSFQYGSLTTLMSNSAKMIKTMEREDLIGKGMVALAFLFFLGCVGILYT